MSIRRIQKSAVHAGSVTRRISNFPAAIDASAGTARSFSCGSHLACLYTATIGSQYRKFQTVLGSQVGSQNSP